ncbi:MAG TPA: hypothetical protein VFC06_01000 [Demequina sp.]|nr:hypothetical protein [Demequina sp.]
MLKRLGLVLVAITLAAPLTASAATAGGTIECPPGTVQDDAGRCIISVDDPGDPGDPGNPPGENDGGDGDPLPCTFGEREIPCTLDGYYWIASRGCYARAADPQPPLTESVWGGRTDGVIVTCVQPSCLGQDTGECYSEIYWAAAAPGAGPTPRQLADRAVAAMDFRAPEIGLTGKSDDPDSMQIIGLPTWMWVADPDEHTVGPITRGASAGGITVTATGTLDKVMWSMGDGRTETCTGSEAQGTPYGDSYNDQPSPTCGHRYLRTSAGQPHEAFTVTATSYWTITWVGGGQSGTIPLTFARTSQLRVGELQVIVTDGTGR